jgi:alpha-amylase
VLNGDMNKAKVAASLLLTAPGTPFIYYGEEIGMQGIKPDEDIRLPMQWTGEAATAGFTTGTPWRAPHASTATVNVAVEDKDPNSLLSHYRTLIALRKAHSGLQTGALALLETGNPGVYAILRYDSTEILLVVINLSDQPVTDYQLTLTEPILTDGKYAPATIFGIGNAVPLGVKNGLVSGYQPLPELVPFGTLVLNVKP